MAEITVQKKTGNDLLNNVGMSLANGENAFSTKALDISKLRFQFYGSVMWSHAYIPIEAIKDWLSASRLPNQEVRSTFLKATSGGTWLDLPSGGETPSKFENLASSLGAKKLIGIDLGNIKFYTRKENNCDFVYKQSDMINGLREIAEASINVVTVCGLQFKSGSYSDMELYIKELAKEIDRVLVKDGYLIVDNYTTYEKGAFRPDEFGFVEITQDRSGITGDSLRMFSHRLA